MVFPSVSSRRFWKSFLILLDPDGNEVQLYVDVPGVDWKGNPSLMMAPGGRLQI